LFIAFHIKTVKRKLIDTIKWNMKRGQFFIIDSLIYLVHLVSLVSIVSLVCLVSLVYPVYLVNFVSLVFFVKLTESKKGS
jgi:hypothetical protein